MSDPEVIQFGYDDNVVIIEREKVAELVRLLNPCDHDFGTIVNYTMGGGVVWRCRKCGAKKTTFSANTKGSSR